MAKRFFDNSRIDQDWYLALSLKERELLRYCESKADGAGIFPFSDRIAAIYVGQKITIKDLEKLPIGRLPNGNYFLYGFCYLQNGKLTEKCNAHKPVFKSLEVNKVDEGSLLGSLPVRLQEEERDIEIEKEEETVSPEISELDKTFEAFIEMRKKIKKPPTEHAIDLIKTKLEELAPKNEKLKSEILNQSIRNSWQDVFPLRVDMAQKIAAKETGVLSSNWLEKK